MLMATSILLSASVAKPQIAWVALLIILPRSAAVPQQTYKDVMCSTVAAKAKTAALGWLLSQVH